MVWKNVEQINQALDDMCNVFSHLPIEEQELFALNMCKYMREMNNTSFYSLQAFKNHLQNAIQYGVNIKNTSVLEIGAGKPLGSGIFWNYAGARKYTSIDKFVQVNLTDLWVPQFQNMLSMNLFNPNHFRMDSIINNDGNQYTLNENKIKLIQGSLEDHPLDENSFDFIYSGAVLEHVTNMQKILQKLHYIMSDDGIAIHLIDLREHHTNLRRVPDKNTSLDYLKYSTEEWDQMYPPGSEFYINRLRASDFEKCFKDTGFKIVDFITTQKMELDETVYSKIHPEFHRYSIEDLSIINVKVVLKKA